MFIKVKEGSIPGNITNEDKFYNEDNFVIFLDGASGLSKGIIPNAKSDANWYVNEFIEQFKKVYKNNDYKYKRYLIKKTIDYTKQAFDGLVNDKSIQNIDIPSASGIILFDEPNHIKGFYFGDVLTVIKKNNKTFKSYSDLNLTNLDNNVFKEANRISVKNNIPFNEAIKGCTKMIIDNRNLRNKDEGYYIFGLDKNAVKKIHYFKIEKDSIDSILMMSDGFYTHFPENDPEKIFEIINGVKSSQLLGNIKSSFLKDEEFSKFNRFKLVDDISYLLLGLN